MKTDDITIRTVQPGERSVQVIEGEIEALKKQIDNRNVWLSTPENKQSCTYDNVKRNTLEMVWDLQELEKELREIQTTLKNK